MVIYDDRSPPKSSTVILVVGIRRWFGISVAHRIIILGFPNYRYSDSPCASFISLKQ